MNAEQIIKHALDGKFFYVNQFTNKVEMKVVDRDFIPDHRPNYQADYAALSDKLRVVKANPWLPEEDEQLLAMRERGVKWDSIRKILQRGLVAVKERYLQLCQERGIEPSLASLVHAPALTSEAKAQIIMLRKQGMKPAEVAEITGRPTYQIVDYYNRFLASKRLGEVV